MFELLGAGGDFAPSSRVAPSIGVPAAEAKTTLLEYLHRAGLNDEQARAEAIAAWQAQGLGAEVTEQEWAALIDRVDRRLAELDDQDTPPAPPADEEPAPPDPAPPKPRAARKR